MPNSFGVACDRVIQSLGTLTPDWTIYDTTGTPREIIDVVTLHPTYEIGRDIASSVRGGQIWTGWITTAPDRLYQKLQAKFGSYTAAAQQEQVAFVVALFSEFTAPIDTEEVAHVVFNLHGGLFKDYRQVSGVIHFESSNGRYNFSALGNHFATNPSSAITRFLAVLPDVA